MTSRIEELIERVRLASDGTAAVVDGVRLVATTSDAIRRELPGYIYAILHAGQPAGSSTMPFHHRDLAFESALADVVPRPHRVVTAPIISEATDGSALVLLDGVNVWVDPARLVEVDWNAGQAKVRLQAARRLLSPGFLVTDGLQTSVSSAHLLRVYLHIAAATSARHVWKAGVDALEECAIPYRAKVLSSAAQYPRRDAMVLYLNGSSSGDLETLIARLEGLDGLGGETSPFALRRAPGIAVAQEPEDSRSGMRGLSFGQHRARILADGLWSARELGCDPVQAVKAEFRKAGISPEEPAFNAALEPQRLAAV